MKNENRIYFIKGFGLFINRLPKKGLCGVTNHTADLRVGNCFRF